MRIHARILALCLLSSFLIPHPARAAVTLLDASDWKVFLGGFVEFDTMYDSTRSLREVVGNTPIARPDTASGANGRSQFSIRNSRFAFTIEPPKAGEWKTRGVLEFDLLGFDPQPGASNSEAAFFNNPTLRVRHAYFQADQDGYQVLMGQTWNLFGWQSYYFMSTADVAPIPGMLYGRTAQLRGSKTIDLSEKNTLQAAVALVRPPQADSRLPSIEAGVRAAFGDRTSGFTSGAVGAPKTQPMSIGLSGTYREFDTPTTGGGVGDVTHYPAGAVAVDALLPILASPDGKDVANTLSLQGEFTTGRGYGDQFGGWTGNMANPLSTSANAASKGVNLDAGIGDYDASGAFHLVDLRTFNLTLQYHLPSGWDSWIDAGYTQLYSDNMDTLANAAGNASGSTATQALLPYDREQAYFVNIFHQVTPQIRVAAEFAQFTTSYSDGVLAHDNRYQLSAWFLF